MGRVLRGMTQRELADATGIDQALISKYENGRSIPDSDLRAIARFLRLPDVFFRKQTFLHAPHGASMMMFRRRQTATGKMQEQVVVEINLLSDKVRDLLKSVEFETISRMPLHEPSDESIDEVEDIAERVRLELRVAPGPVPSMVRVLESIGVIIVKQRLPPKIDALVDAMPGHPTILLLSDSILGGRERMTMAHELGHLVMHPLLNFSYKALEDQADRFAAAFLMPRNDIRAELRDISMERLIALSSKWRVSVQALVHRAVDLEVIGERQGRFWYEQLGKSGFRNAEPTPIAPETPTLLKSLLRLHMDDLRYSVEELAEVMQMEEWEFRKTYMDEPPAHLATKQKKPILRPSFDGK